MDFYQYLNSKDVAEHLRRMDYQFSTLECVWIVYISENITLSEKLAALKYILTMPDQMRTCGEYPEGISVHKTIHQYFNYVETIKTELRAKDDNAFYTYNIFDKEGWAHHAEYFRDYESCMASYYQTLLGSIDPSLLNRREILGYKIEKIPFNTQSDTISAEYRGSELVSIHKCGDWDPLTNVLVGNSVVDIYEAHFPIPFLPGDILYDPFCQRPMVLVELPSTDEGIYPMGYRVSDDGKTVIHYMCEMFYTELEYYRGELDGSDIALSVISDFIKTNKWFKLK